MMNPCEKYEEWMSAYVDGVLSEAEQAEFLAHIETCPSCREVLAEYQMLSEALDDMNVMPPATLTADIMAKIQAKPELTVVRRGSMVRRIMAIAAALAVVTFVGIQMFGPAAPAEFGGAGESWSAPEMAASPMAAPLPAGEEAEVMDEIPAPASPGEVARGPMADTADPAYTSEADFEPFCQPEMAILASEFSLFDLFELGLIFEIGDVLFDWNELRGKLAFWGYTYEVEDDFFTVPDSSHAGSYLYGRLTWGEEGSRVVTLLGYAYRTEDDYRRVELRTAYGEASYYYDVIYVGRGGTSTETWVRLRAFLMLG